MAQTLWIKAEIKTIELGESLTRPTATGRTAYQRIPENLPAGIYVVATTRPVADRTALARRPDLHWYDLDAPDLLQENLWDGAEYVIRELVHSDPPAEAVAAIARAGSGNFLVLKRLCDHVRSMPSPETVRDFLRRLAIDGRQDQQGSSPTSSGNA